MMQGTGGFGMTEGWYGMFFGPVIMIGIVVLIIFLVVALVRGISGISGSSGGGDQGRITMEKSALDILKERYARGEIDESEYRERRRILGN